MADICNTSVIIKGSKEVLQIIAHDINMGGGLKSDVFDPLGLTEKELFFDEVVGEAVVVNIGGQPFLSLDLRTMEYADRELWDYVGFPEGVYYEMHTIETEEHLCNDRHGVYFDKPFSICVIDDNGEDKYAKFKTEDEAVRFAMANCPGIPKELKTIDEIDTYCSDHELHHLCYYGHTVLSNICSPITTRIIWCLADVIKELTMAKTNNLIPNFENTETT